MAMRKARPSPRSKPSPGFMKSAAKTNTSLVSEAFLRQARKSGSLNLSNRSLEVVPTSVWHINSEPPADHNASFSTQDEEKWWDQVDLTKLLLADNQIKEIPDDVASLTALFTLDIHSNQLSSLPDAIGELQQLKKLVLSHNELASLPSTLTALTNLQLLKLDHNQLTALPVGLGSLVHLEEFDASHNLLSDLPLSLGDMKALKTLAITHNRLENIPELGSLTRLKQLSLNNNKLTSLPELAGSPSLQILECNYNQLTELPLLPQGTALKELHYGYNGVSTVDPDRLIRLQSLVFLNLRDNKISSIPECIVEVATLERLDLTNNDLSGLPYVMGNMANFKALLLDGNPLRSLRREVVQRGTMGILKYLRSRIQTEESTAEPAHHSTKFTPTKANSAGQGVSRITSDVAALSLEGKNVDLSKKGLTEIPTEVYSNTHLTTLNVGHNKIAVVHPQISVFTSLTLLDIRNNRVSELPQELQDCSKLSEVILSFNAFSTIPRVLFSLKSIETILANDNQIADIDVDGLLQLPLLGCLDLQNNSISQVPPRLGTVTTLKHLQLSGNSFRIPRAAILSKGTGPLLEYLRNRIPA